LEYKHAIIVGASSGIGLELVRQLTAAGCKVAGVARRAERLEGMPGVLAFKHDVTHYDEVPGLFQEITKQLGGLDLIIYSSGVMPAVGGQEYNFEKDREMIEVNVLGCIAWMNQAAIRFENTKSGSMVVIGSVAGERGRSGQPVYNTSKAAVATYMEAIRNRISRYGVKVVTVKPGPTKTEMTESLHMRGAMDAAKVASVILKKSQKTGEHYVKFSHRVMFWVIRNFPGPIFRKLHV
jgi:decaprenylphospho-beta-D-erythro-pentofuranosid-2-ulose 2-reductase